MTQKRTQNSVRVNNGVNKTSHDRIISTPWPVLDLQPEYTTTNTDIITYVADPQKALHTCSELFGPWLCNKYV